MVLVKGGAQDFCYMGGGTTLGTGRWCILTKAGAQAVNDNEGFTHFYQGNILPAVAPGQYFTLLQVIDNACTFAQAATCS